MRFALERVEIEKYETLDAEIREIKSEGILRRCLVEFWMGSFRGGVRNET